MLEVRLNNQNLKPVLQGAPTTSDQLNSACRTLDFTIAKTAGLNNVLGQMVELWYGGKRWFIGQVRKRRFTAEGSITYTAYDPLYFFIKNPDDFYIKHITATQAIRQLADKVGVKVYSLANTGYTLPPLFYRNADADKIAVDVLARTYNATNKKYWYRYRPYADGEGLHLFERVVPSKIWAFQVGINLVTAEYEESIESTATTIKLINRETGKVVTRTNAAAAAKYGNTTYFEEADNNQGVSMEKQAADLLAKLSVVSTTMSIEGINPNVVMPQFFSGDAIYVQESNTGIMGGYYIRNVTQNFVSDDLVQLGIEIQAAPDIPQIQYSDATKDPSQTK